MNSSLSPLEIAPFCDTIDQTPEELLLSPTTTTAATTNQTFELNSSQPSNQNQNHHHNRSISNASTKIITSTTFDNGLFEDKPMHSTAPSDTRRDGSASKQQSEENSVDGNNARANKREMYKFETDWLISTLAWSNKPSSEPFQLALCSFIDNYKNYVQLVSLAEDSYDQEIQSISIFEHPYPATKILWLPRPENYNYPSLQSTQSCSPNNNSASSLLATTADYLRLWRVQESSKLSGQDNGFLGRSRSSNSNSFSRTTKYDADVKLECLLNCNPGSKLCAPLTSFDWNDIDPRLIVTSSVDTTCAIWDLDYQKLLATCSHIAADTAKSLSFDGCNIDLNNHQQQLVTGTLKTQLVAHDHQVYDVSFSRIGSGRDVIVSCSGDQSVRLFDLRKLSTSTVLYESSNQADRKALVRVSCSRQNENLVSTFAIDSSEILVLDTRRPGRPVCSLKNHLDNVNSMSWAPHSGSHLCTASDDCQALIWDLSTLPEPIGEPLLAYRARGKINTISWSSSQSDWIAIGYQNHLELLRV